MSDNFENAVLSNEVILDNAMNLTDSDEETKLFRCYKSAINYRNNGTIVKCKTSFVERIADDDEHFYVLANLFDHLKLYIRDDEYFIGKNDFGKDYEMLSLIDKRERRMNVALSQLGARITVVITSVNWFKVNDVSKCVAYASRVKANAIRQDRFFFHKLPRKPETKLQVIHNGDKCKAEVIQVKSYMIVVEAFGVETRVASSNISNEFIKDARVFYKPGDVVPMYVKTSGIDENGNAYLSLTGRISDPQAFEKMQTGMLYRGNVIKFNAEKKGYTIILENGVHAFVRSYQVANQIPLQWGDAVIVVAEKMLTEDKFIFGSCRKM